MLYRVYYDDESFFDGELADVPNTQAYGVEVIVQFDEHSAKWYLQHRADVYLWKEDRWVGGDSDAQTIYMIRPGWKRVLYGETVHSLIYQESVKKALAFADDLSARGVTPYD